MTPQTNATLAQLSLAAYSDAPAALPAGFTMVDTSNLVISLAPGETLSNSIFQSGNGAALVTTGYLDGFPVIALAFRGSDDATDSQQDLGGINQAYASFDTLIAAVDQAAETYGVPVIVTGHSLGGAMAQIYMATHPDEPGGPLHGAATFGSPGAILPPGEDARIQNYVIADDPAVVLGAQRAEFGELLRSDPTLANLAADRIAQELPGLTREQALATLPNLTVNYDNRGDIILLPDRDGQLTVESAIANLARADAARHAVDLYVADVADATAPGQSLLVPAAASSDPTLTTFHALYDGDGRTPGTSDALARDLLRAFADDQLGGLGSDVDDAITEVRDGLDGLGRDLNLV